MTFTTKGGGAGRNNLPKPKSVSGSDDDYTWEFTTKTDENGKPELELLLLDKNGKILFQGPFSRSRDIKTLPAPVAERLDNPRTRTAESLNRGKWVYATYCLVCHGDGGKGDGPISAAVGGPFPGIRDLTDALARSRSDGYLYGLVTNAPVMGRPVMPHYGDKVRGTDRWDVVNYVRQLQQQAGGGPR